MNEAQCPHTQLTSPDLDSRSEQALLEKRARELARPYQLEDEGGARLALVEFTMAHERYGVESRFVKEVHPLRELTPVPGTPPFVLGIVNVRGHVVSLVDLKRFFSLPEKGLTDTNHLILLSCPAMEFGILADSILGVRDIPVCELQGDLPTFTGHRKAYLLGVSRDGTVVLDAGQILGDPGIVVRDGGTD